MSAAPADPTPRSGILTYSTNTGAATFVVDGVQTDVLPVDCAACGKPVDIGDLVYVRGQATRPDIHRVHRACHEANRSHRSSAPDDYRCPDVACLGETGDQSERVACEAERLEMRADSLSAAWLRMTGKAGES